MAKRDYPYPEDEFDALGTDRVPQGVHRAPVPRWRALLPFIVVLILAPLLAYVGVTYLSNLGSPSSTTAPAASGEPTAAPEETAAPEDSAASEETTAPEESESPTAEPEPTAEEATILRDTPVFVLNGAGVAGLAGTASEKLTADGFTDVTPDNYSSSAPTASTVYYNNADLADTAQQVASVLGIGQLVELASATDSIAVVLRGDYVP